MGRSLERSFLGEAAARLARGLGLQGLLSPQFDRNERIIPVALVVDGTAPGMGDFRGRRWGVGLVIAGGGATHTIGIRASTDVVIESVTISCTDAAGSEVRGFYNGPDDADPFAMATRNVQWLDRGQSSLDLAPLTTGTVTPQNLVGSSIFRATVVTNQLMNVPALPMPFLLVAGAKIHFSSSGIADMRVNFYGRSF